MPSIESFVKTRLEKLNDISSNFVRPREFKIINDANYLSFNSTNPSEASANYNPYIGRMNVFMPDAKERSLYNIFGEGWIEDLLDDIDIESLDAASYGVNKLDQSHIAFNRDNIPDNLGYKFAAQGFYNIIVESEYHDDVDDSKKGELVSEAAKQIKGSTIHELNHAREFNHLMDVEESAMEEIQETVSLHFRNKRLFKNNFDESIKAKKKARDQHVEPSDSDEVIVAASSPKFKYIAELTLREYAKWERKEVQEVSDFDEEIERLGEEISDDLPEGVINEFLVDIEKAKNNDYLGLLRKGSRFELEDSKYEELLDTLEERYDQAEDFIEKKNKTRKLYFNSLAREMEINNGADEEIKQVFKQAAEVPSPEIEAFSNFLGYASVNEVEAEEEKEKLYDNIENYDFSDEIKPVLDDIFCRYEQLDDKLDYSEKIGRIMDWELKYLEQAVEGNE
jgi:hypothetical protein